MSQKILVRQLFFRGKYEKKIIYIISGIGYIYDRVLDEGIEKLFRIFNNEYKLELINELPDNEVITVYYTGEGFVDLCRGPHVENTKFLRSFAFKIEKI